MSENQTYTNHELLHLLNQGDELAFVEFYRTYRNPIRIFLEKFLKSPELSEDLGQEIFLQIWESRGRMDHIRSLHSWVYTLARNKALDMLRRASVDMNAKAEILKHYHTVSTTTYDQVLTKEYLDYIQSVIATLPPQTQKVWQLCREREFSYEEVAEKLGISRNAVKKHMMRSMKVLREGVEKDFGISFSIFISLLNLS